VAAGDRVNNFRLVKFSTSLDNQAKRASLVSCLGYCGSKGRAEDSRPLLGIKNKNNIAVRGNLQETSTLCGRCKWVMVKSNLVTIQG
jgi:hypothetical protein